MAISDLVCIKEPIKNSLSEQSFTPQHQIPPCSTQSDQQQFSGFAFSSFYQKYSRQNNEHYNYYCIYTKHIFITKGQSACAPKECTKLNYKSNIKQYLCYFFNSYLKWEKFNLFEETGKWLSTSHRYLPFSRT